MTTIQISSQLIGLDRLGERLRMDQSSLLIDEAKRIDAAISGSLELAQSLDAQVQVGIGQVAGEDFSPEQFGLFRDEVLHHVNLVVNLLTRSEHLWFAAQSRGLKMSAPVERIEVAKRESILMRDKIKSWPGPESAALPINPEQMRQSGDDAAAGRFLPWQVGLNGAHP